MAKRYDEEIEMTAEEGPLSFVWRGRRYDIDQPLMFEAGP
jgi:hypothetical protein